jgi:response regulator RpfG family c-di-GMP phosphodiesterase
VKQCSILIVNCSRREATYLQPLIQRGFRVVETYEWPEDAEVRHYEVVILVLRDMESVSMLAARMRAKPRFGFRILLGLNPTTPSPEERRNAIGAGFDDVVGESRDSRALIASILKILHGRPEHRCFLPDLKRPAA